MEWYWALTLLIGCVLVFLAIGLPVAFAFFCHQHNWRMDISWWLSRVDFLCAFYSTRGVDFHFGPHTAVYSNGRDFVSNRAGHPGY